MDWRYTDSAAFLALVEVVMRHVRGFHVWAASPDRDLVRALGNAGATTLADEPTFALRTTEDVEARAELGGVDLRRLSSWELRMLDSDEY